MEEFLSYQEILALFINTVIGLAIPFVAREVVRLLAQGVEYVKASIAEKNPEMLDILYYVAAEAVSFAEQAGLKEIGAAKLDMAIGYAQREMNQRGFGDVDLEVIVAKIEAALFSEMNQYKDAFKG